MERMFYKFSFISLLILLPSCSGDDEDFSAFARPRTVYAATRGGLSISTDGGVNFINQTISDGLGSGGVNDVSVVGSNVYAATGSGLSISTDGGVSFINRTISDGLGDDEVNGVFVAGSNVYAATSGGLSISTDGGVNFINRTVSDGLIDNEVSGVFVVGNNVYAATNRPSWGGFTISNDGEIMDDRPF